MLLFLLAFLSNSLQLSSLSLQFYERQVRHITKIILFLIRLQKKTHGDTLTSGHGCYENVEWLTSLPRGSKK